ncbi:phospho-N-acetylmuramoyl-pentapeptide-transferase [Cytophagaceae bacterium DM2B3-1]|uniref:Phospho-N-acetylmuramoyl-pentapeptide-transferase n=1 Tax=Xanthocytophaga flava TaxID=3048013 RepID=A0ABT7CHS7_9BACT|nr:phospho-N-acetylmuramoyl-pentapeptide-transferase [Xanthocytophaga flavus]MDJ1468400.1 phospho-N-acetylmuramoyl-pentapeptide-transferase [Xanthocytophaga flavus]MDJ1493286.1 phospho-N-acetylmuramoyl-pentapeptide-transferase [Xanthocytophaga flavus]
MLYYLFDYLDKQFDFFGAGVFRFLSFRASMALIIAMSIGAIYGKQLINLLRRLQVGESIRDLGLQGQAEKKGTPTMGGFIIIGSILLPVLLFARLDNVYIILLLVSTVWLGLIGFLDDYVKVFKKESSLPWLAGDRGIKGKIKIVGQIGLGLIIGLTLYYNNNVVIRKYEGRINYDNIAASKYHDIKSLTTTVPFFKNNELDYGQILPFLPDDYQWIVYVLVAIFIITAVSNGANITDGIDGLAAGISAIIGLTLGLFAYLSGNAIFANYLKIMYIPHLGELVIFCAAFVGACVGFLWYNSYPASVFMGDTGSLTLGGIIAVIALIVRKELMIPIICGVFLAESISVILQVYYFKYQKRRRGIEYAREHRLFKMAPLHHHYQRLGYHESKIVIRFFIIAIILAVFSIATLKLR